MSKQRRYAYVVALIVVAACAKKGTQPGAQEGEQGQTQAQGGMTPPSSEGMGESAMGGTSSSESGMGATAGSAPERLTDAQIARIAEVIDTGEVEQAQLAQSRASDPRVKKFAAHMLSDHGRDKQQTQAVAQQEGITPSESSVSSDLQSKTSQAMQTLQTSQGSQFDSAYMESQVQQHMSALDLISNSLLPSTADPDLKAQLEQARSMVQSHLAEAQQIQQSLPPAGPSSAIPTQRPLTGSSASR